MKYEVNEYEVLETEQIDTGTQIVTVKRHHTFTKHINFKVDNNMLTILWTDWKGNVIDFEPTTLRITNNEEYIIVELTEPIFSLENILGKIESINDKVKNDCIELKDNIV